MFIRVSRVGNTCGTSTRHVHLTFLLVATGNIDIVSRSMGRLVFRCRLMCIGGVSTIGVVIIIIQNYSGPGTARHVNFILLLVTAGDVDILLLVVGHAPGSPEQESRSSRYVGLVHNRGWQVWLGIVHYRGWLITVVAAGVNNTRGTSTRHMDVSRLLIAARNMHLAVNRSMMNRPVEGLMRNRGWSVRILHSRLGYMGLVRASRVNNTSGTSTGNMDVSFLLVAARNVHLTVNRSMVNRRISLCNTDRT